MKNITLFLLICLASPDLCYSQANNDLSVSFDTTEIAGSNSHMSLFYSLIPSAQVLGIDAHARFENVGNATQTSCRVSFKLKHGGAVIDSLDGSAAGALQSGGVGYTAWSTLNSYPSPLGAYKLTAAASSDSVDDNPIDNIDTASFTLTDSIWSINKDTKRAGVYRLLQNMAGANFRYGTLYEVIAPDTVTSITTAVVGGPGGTQPGAIIKGTIYQITSNGGLSYTTPWVSTSLKGLNSSDITSPSATDVTPVTLPLDFGSGNPILAPGLYWVCIEGIGTPDSNINIAATASSKGGISLVEDYTAPGTLTRLSNTDAIYCNLNFGRTEHFFAVDFTMSPATQPVHLGRSINFLAQSDVSTTNFYWDITGLNTGFHSHRESPVMHDTFYVHDTYTVCLTGIYINDTARKCRDIETDTVLPCLLQASFGVANTAPQVYTVYNYTQGSSLSYLWDFGDSSTSDQPYPSHTYATAGYYAICLNVTDTTMAGCTSSYCDATRYYNKTNGTDGMVTVYVVPASVGLKDINTDGQVALYPSPATQDLTIDARGESPERIRIYSVSGQMVSDETNARTHINVSAWSAGIYVVEVTMSDCVKLLKFVKE